MPFLEEILCQARGAGASDVHLTVGAPPGMRINGGLVSMGGAQVLPNDTVDILIRVMSEVQREKLEERGEYDCSFSLPGCGRCRLHAYSSGGSMALAIRLVRETIPTPEKLGLPEEAVGLCLKKRGLVLVAGPSGSGKSTTLAAMVEKINASQAAHIVTLEKPVEYLHPHKLSLVNQREIGTDCQDSAGGVAAALRQDPDVILVGELQDPETTEGAVRAAETGHLVLAGVSAAGAEDVLERLLEAFPSQRQRGMRIRLAEVLEAVIFQRLVPAEEGGRKALFEILYGDPGVRELIRKEKLRQLSGMKNTYS